MQNSVDSIYGHKVPKEFMLIQERSQLHAYNTKAKIPDGHGFEVFIYNLPRDILIQHVYKFAKQSGDIYDIRILMDFSGFNRGMCYVKFLTRIAARKAVLVYDHSPVLPNHPVHIRMSFDNNKLIMQRIPKSIPRGQVSSLITSLVGEGMTSISLEDQQGETNSYCCYLTYQNHRKALEARKKLWPGIELWDTLIPIEWAEPPELKQSRILYFKNFPEGATRLELFTVLTSMIDIQTVLKLRLDETTGSIIFTGCETRKEGQKLLTAMRRYRVSEKEQNLKLQMLGMPIVYCASKDSRILGRKLYLSHRRFPIARNPNKDLGVKAVGEENKMALPTTGIENQLNNSVKIKIADPGVPGPPPNLDYQSCSKAMLDRLPVFSPPPVHTTPGFYNELEAVQGVIHTFLENKFPNSSWTCLDPEENEVRPHLGAIIVRPTINTDMYEFVLVCVSSELANGCAGFIEYPEKKAATW